MAEGGNVFLAGAFRKSQHEDLSQSHTNPRKAGGHTPPPARSLPSRRKLRHVTQLGAHLSPRSKIQLCAGRRPLGFGFLTDMAETCQGDPSPLQRRIRLLLYPKRRSSGKSI